VGFFDLRGFTSWSSQRGRTATEIQSIIRAFEEQFQKAFSKAWCHRLFTKGTGDGFMIVSEAGWGHELAKGNGGFQLEHAALFAKACSTLVLQTRPLLPETLAIGCGIAIGEITCIFLLGRYDYIGLPINEAAKIQQICWDELCVTKGFKDALKADGMLIKTHRLPGKGWRLDPQNCLKAAESLKLRD
jgi:class 3 adenylate cyclase